MFTCMFICRVILLIRARTSNKILTPHFSDLLKLKPRPLALDLGLMFPFSGARTHIENDQRREKAGRTNTVHDDSDRRQESVEDVPVCGGKRGGRRCGVRAR
jgi:hypothetical protein